MKNIAQRRAVLFCLGLLLLTNMARSVKANPTSNFVEEDTARSSMNSFFNEMRYIYQIYKECSEEEVNVSPCLKLRLLSAMDRVSRSAQLDVTDGVTFLREGSVNEQEEVSKSLQEIEANLPRALNDKEEALNGMIFDRIVKFIQSHTLKLKLPNVEELQRSFSEEGRRKKNKMSGLLAIPMLIGGTLVPLALGALALLAGKALIVSKLALVLASIIGLKKLVSSGHEHGHEVVQVAAGGHGSSGWARSSHELAYSAYKTETKKKEEEGEKVFEVMAFLMVAYGAPTTQEVIQSPSILEEALDIYASCSGESDLSVCLKLKALRFVDRVARAADINVIDGFRIVQTEEAKSNSRIDNARSFNDIESSLPSEVEAKEAAIDQAIVDRAAKFLSTHTVELSLPEEFSRSLDEARGKKKKIVKSLLPILLLVKAKAAILIPLALGALALLAFKALVIGKIALIISAIIGLQKLLASKNQSYEVVAHPVHSHAHYEADHGDHHGWARSAGSDLAYSAYKPSE
ncbi:uncharacterized protein LOC124423237 [Vespa crabro]|uniref:uncharacterized protein LOC124423237 n=1 Tax=Vespa crabro TaxID=7445 RepID=UPI001F02E5AB|nr:uncharacterized protein LOC124423237 [Vespa crabro]